MYKVEETLLIILEVYKVRQWCLIDQVNHYCRGSHIVEDNLVGLTSNCTGMYYYQYLTGHQLDRVLTDDCPGQYIEIFVYIVGEGFVQYIL